MRTAVLLLVALLTGCANPIYNPDNVTQDQLATVSAHKVLLVNNFSRPDTNIVLVTDDNGRVIFQGKGRIVANVRLSAGSYTIEVQCLTSWGYAFVNSKLAVAPSRKYEISCNQVPFHAKAAAASVTITTSR